MTTFLGVWHQSLALTSRLLRGRRGVRGGDSRLHCAVLPVRGLTGGRGSGYVGTSHFWVVFLDQKQPFPRPGRGRAAQLEPAMPQRRNRVRLTAPRRQRQSSVDQGEAESAGTPLDTAPDVGDIQEESNGTVVADQRLDIFAQLLWLSWRCCYGFNAPLPDVCNLFIGVSRHLL